MWQKSWALGLALLTVAWLNACSSNPPAPVIERNANVAKPATAKPTPAKPKTSIEKDWRPDSYTVKKGDTLYSIGLEYGYDYKEIAQNNHIQAPYTIRIGQKLSFAELNKEANAEAANNGVVVTPLKTEPVLSNTPSASNQPPLITEPKAKRDVYSDATFNAPTPPSPSAKPISKPTVAASEVKPETSKADTSKVDTNKPEANKPTAEPVVVAGELTDWAWPAQGKLIAKFNESSNKGIDIAGTQGQPILAANAGKVIYSGSDLRSYGKMVIIKHNSQYLSVYAHNHQILVKEGQQISKGQKIAEMGKTDSSQVKLHFEIRRQGKSIDPLKYLP